jgi:hypothetical protein
MRHSRTFLLTTAFCAGLGLVLGASGSAHAVVVFLPGQSVAEEAVVVDPFLVKFDENGNATISQNGGPATTLVGTLLPDPANKGGPMALTYKLPERVISGDVSFSEPAPGTGISDWLRFTDAQGTISGDVTDPASTVMIFYSDLEPGESNPDLADVGFPTNLGTGLAAHEQEIGAEGNNGFDYRPGGVPAPQNNEYIGISDRAVATPEPASLVLLGGGLAALGLLRRRHRG